MDSKIICEICGVRLAEYHFTKTSGGKSRTFHICGSCKRILDEELDKKARRVNIQSVPEEQRICLCGASLSDVLKSGYAGCSECYTTFREHLTEAVKNYHGSSQHKGRNGRARPPVDIEKLYLELKKAVDDERFSDAAKLKAHIDELRKDWEGE